jgi:hypothetical protein
MNSVLTDKNSVSCLSIRRLPARLNSEQVAQVLGFQPHDIPFLTKEGLLKPLGGGPRNSVKFFAAVEIEELGRDRKWLDRATKAVSRSRQALGRQNESVLVVGGRRNV